VSLHAPNDADRRDGDAPGADAEELRVDEHPHGCDRRIEVGERLAHPHRDDVGDALAARHELALPVADLIDDLSHREIADQAHLARRAERAGHRAAGLSREAHRIAGAVVGHEDRLDVMPVVQLEQHLARLPVGALDLAHRLDRAPAEAPRQGVTEHLRKVGDAVPIGCGAARDLPADLLRAIPRLPALLEPQTERGPIDVGDRRTRVAAHRARCGEREVRVVHHSSVPV
jgi:hypothetical protein